MDIRYLGHATLRALRRRRPRARRPVPVAEQPEGAGQRGRGRPDPHPAHARARRPPRRRRRDRQADRRALRRAGRDRGLARRAGSRERLRPQPRRHGRVRLGLGEARAGLPQLDHARRHGHLRERPGDQHRRHDRLPPRRHVPVRRPEADRAAHSGRRRADPDRRPLHDGPPRRGRRGRADRRRHRDPLPLQHLPADRDRRAGVQVGRRVEDQLEGGRAEPGATPQTSC